MLFQDFDDPAQSEGRGLQRRPIEVARTVVQGQTGECPAQRSPSISGVRQPLNQSMQHTPPAPGGGSAPARSSSPKRVCPSIDPQPIERRRRRRPGRSRSRTSPARCRPARRPPRRARGLLLLALSMWQLLVPMTMTMLSASATPAPGTPACASMIAALTGMPAAGPAASPSPAFSAPARARARGGGPASCRPRHPPSADRSAAKNSAEG